MKRVLVAVAALLLSGCAQYTPTLKADVAPTGEEGFLYGRFQVGRNEYGTVSSNQMGFVFRCVNAAKKRQHDYTLRFTFEEPIQVIKVKPAVCSLREIVYTNEFGVIQTRNPAPEGVYRNVQVEAGKAYYLGDYYAVIATTSTGYNTYRTVWRIQDIKNDYALTTEKVKQRYPGLAGVPTEDLASNP
jgi:hypothetical protein